MDTPQDVTQRGSADLWTSAAYEALIGQGVDAVKILPLAARLGLSRTSFYWFFKDRAALLDALAEMWEGRTTTPLIEAAGAYAETAQEAMLNVIGCLLSHRFDQRLEFAVRGWALQDAAILTRLHAADEVRHQALLAMMQRWGRVGVDADVRARATYLVQIGYVATQARESLDERLARVPNYVEIFTGAPPTPAEMARLTASLRACAAGPQPSA